MFFNNNNISMQHKNKNKSDELILKINKRCNNYLTYSLKIIRKNKLFTTTFSKILNF